MYGSGKSGENEEKDGKVGCRDVYNRSTELVLVLSSDLYSLLKSISVSASRPSSYSILYCLLTTFTTDYCLKRTVNNFGLRRLFYSK